MPFQGVSPHSIPPNIGNYFIGRGFATAQFATDPAPVDLGNITLFEFEVKPTLLPHYSSRVGVQKKDFVATTRLEATLTIEMEEIVARNMQFLLLSTLSKIGGTFSLKIMDTPELFVAFHFTGTNAVGAQWDADFPVVLLTPNKAISLISAGSGAWGTISLQGDVLFDDHSNSFGTFTSTDIASP
jgi:hypothetical protein